jgi:hypothetical protein
MQLKNEKKIIVSSDRVEYTTSERSREPHAAKEEVANHCQFRQSREPLSSGAESRTVFS